MGRGEDAAMLPSRLYSPGRSPRARGRGAGHFHGGGGERVGVLSILPRAEWLGVKNVRGSCRTVQGVSNPPLVEPP